MTDSKPIFNFSQDEELPDELKDLLIQTQADLKGSKRRQFMARVVSLFGHGGQSRAERELGWDRGVIRKGTNEIHRELLFFYRVIIIMPGIDSNEISAYDTLSVKY